MKWSSLYSHLLLPYTTLVSILLSENRAIQPVSGASFCDYTVINLNTLIRSIKGTRASGYSTLNMVNLFLKYFLRQRDKLLNRGFEDLKWGRIQSSTTKEGMKREMFCRRERGREFGMKLIWSTISWSYLALCSQLCWGQHLRSRHGIKYFETTGDIALIAMCLARPAVVFKNMGKIRTIWILRPLGRN